LLDIYNVSLYMSTRALLKCAYQKMNWNNNGLRKTATQLHGIVVACVL